MQLIAGFETFLYIFSSSLLFPVILCLIFLIFWICYQSGVFLREWIERRNNINPVLEDFKNELEKIFLNYSEIEMIKLEIEKLIEEKELELIKELDKVRFVVRVGPALGLLGTIIPMGIALAELAKGNLPKMASNMVTAFSTTVAGLTCGTIAYVISLIKQKWIKKTLDEMEYLAKVKLQKFNKIIIEENYNEVEKKGIVA